MIPRTRQFVEKVAELGREGQAFAVATVVARRAPVSAHLGDRAIIYADGRMEGFVGGACSREIARTHALESIRTRHPRLVSIRPDASEAGASDPEHVVVPMTCVSEGAIDVYIEPFVPPRRLVVIGATPVADALARVAAAIECDVVHVLDRNELRDRGVCAADGTDQRTVSLDSLREAVTGAGGDLAVVVATQGHYDEDALALVLEHDIPYVGLVASRRRAAAVRSSLEGRGAGKVGAIRAPAGLNLGARTPSEVALSILAEIVQAQPAERPQASAASESHAVGTDVHGPGAETGSTARDPVCGMQVEVANARYTAEAEGTRYYFCCAHCRTRFMADPREFLHAS